LHETSANILENSSKGAGSGGQRGGVSAVRRSSVSWGLGDHDEKEGMEEGGGGERGGRGGTGGGRILDRYSI